VALRTQSRSASVTLTAPSPCALQGAHGLAADAEAVDLAGLGPAIEHNALFPQRTNVEFAALLGPDHLRMRVWERGAGVTLACGSGACATAVAAHLRGLTGRKVRLDMDGGVLWVDWRDDGVWLTGPVAHVFDGVVSAEFLAAHA
jgi:diaminopimelate epimerase